MHNRTKMQKRLPHDKFRDFLVVEKVSLSSLGPSYKDIRCLCIIYWYNLLEKKVHEKNFILKEVFFFFNIFIILLSHNILQSTRIVNTFEEKNPNTYITYIKRVRFLLRKGMRSEDKFFVTILCLYLVSFYL